MKNWLLKRRQASPSKKEVQFRLACKEFGRALAESDSCIHLRDNARMVASERGGATVSCDVFVIGDNVVISGMHFTGKVYFAPWADNYCVMGCSAGDFVGAFR